MTTTFWKNIVQSLFLNTWLQNMIMTMEVMPLGWSAAVYKMVQVSDMGTKAENKVKVIIDGTTIKFDKVEQLTKF